MTAVAVSGCGVSAVAVTAVAFKTMTHSMQPRRCSRLHTPKRHKLLHARHINQRQDSGQSLAARLPLPSSDTSLGTLRGLM